MSLEEWLAQTNGTLQAIVLACTALIATHPEKEKVLALLQALTEQAADVPQDTPERQHYKLGIREAVSQMAKGVETAQLATEIRDLKSSSGTH